MNATFLGFLGFLGCDWGELLRSDCSRWYPRLVSDQACPNEALSCTLVSRVLLSFHGVSRFRSKSLSYIACCQQACLVPDPKDWRGPRPIHARAEVIDELRTFRGAFIDGERGIVVFSSAARFHLAAVRNCGRAGAVARINRPLLSHLGARGPS